MPSLGEPEREVLHRPSAGTYKLDANTAAHPTPPPP